MWVLKQNNVSQQYDGQGSSKRFWHSNNTSQNYIHLWICPNWDNEFDPVHLTDIVYPFSAHTWIVKYESHRLWQIYKDYYDIIQIWQESSNDIGI